MEGRGRRLGYRLGGFARAFASRPRQSFRTLEVFPRLVEGAEIAGRWVEHPVSADGKTTSEHRLLQYFDSVHEGPGIWKWRHYFDIYERHLKKFVGGEVHVAEVGVYSGGSLKMWREFFGEGCRVYGIDIEESARAYEDDVTQIFIGDQSDRSFWSRFRAAVPRVDILIDDGGHLAEQQIPTLEEMLPHLRPGGVYVCEDVLGPRNGFAAYVSGLGHQLNEFVDTGDGSPATGIQAHVDSIHLYPYVVVIEKTPTTVRRFESQKHGTQWEPFIRPW
jgi:SAM-dependent methyltransferase